MRIVGVHRDSGGYSVELENGELLEGIASGEVTQDGMRDYLRLELNILVPMETIAAHARPEDGYAHRLRRFQDGVAEHPDGFFTRESTAGTPPPATITPDEYRRAIEGVPADIDPVNMNVITVHNLAEETPAMSGQIEWQRIQAERNRLEQHNREQSPNNLPQMMAQAAESRRTAAIEERARNINNPEIRGITQIERNQFAINREQLLNGEMIAPRMMDIPYRETLRGEVDRTFAFETNFPPGELGVMRGATITNTAFDETAPIEAMAGAGRETLYIDGERVNETE